MGMALESVCIEVRPRATGELTRLGNV